MSEAEGLVARLETCGTSDLDLISEVLVYLGYISPDALPDCDIEQLVGSTESCVQLMSSVLPDWKAERYYLPNERDKFGDRQSILALSSERPKGIVRADHDVADDRVAILTMMVRARAIELGEMDRPLSVRLFVGFCEFVQRLLSRRQPL